MKLYRMLEEAERQGKEDIVSFLSHGRAFKIHKPKQFEAEIMQKYFTTTRMPSFQRQLNLYGFRRITEGPEKGGYFHDLFLKGEKKLCKKIKRKRSSTRVVTLSTESCFAGGVLVKKMNSSRFFRNERVKLRVFC